jgi:hypothetical protein
MRCMSTCSVASLGFTVFWAKDEAIWSFLLQDGGGGGVGKRRGEERKSIMEGQAAVARLAAETVVKMCYSMCYLQSGMD